MAWLRSAPPSGTVLAHGPTQWLRPERSPKQAMTRSSGEIQTVFRKRNRLVLDLKSRLKSITAPEEHQRVVRAATIRRSRVLLHFYSSSSFFFASALSSNSLMTSIRAIFASSSGNMG